MALITSFLNKHLLRRYIEQLFKLKFQLLGKYPTLFLKKPALQNLLNRRSHFWQLKYFDKNLQNECEEILVTTTKFVRYFIIVTFLVIMNFFLQPILTGDLPVRVYVPHGWFHYINLMYWYLIPVIIGSIYGSDLIFCSICVPLIIQFKLLAHKFENIKLEKMGERKFRKELKKMVDHQNFLIELRREIFYDLSSIVFF